MISCVCPAGAGKCSVDSFSQKVYTCHRFVYSNLLLFMTILEIIRETMEDWGIHTRVRLELSRERLEDPALIILLSILFHFDDCPWSFSNCGHFCYPEQQLGSSYRQTVGKCQSLGSGSKGANKGVGEPQAASALRFSLKSSGLV